MSHSADYESVFHYRNGFHSGVKVERERILEALRAKAATRTVFETLAAPFYIEELEQTIREAQDDED